MLEKAKMTDFWNEKIEQSGSPKPVKKKKKKEVNVKGRIKFIVRSKIVLNS